MNIIQVRTNARHATHRTILPEERAPVNLATAGINIKMTISREVANIAIARTDGSQTATGRAVHKRPAIRRKEEMGQIANLATGLKNINPPLLTQAHPATYAGIIRLQTEHTQAATVPRGTHGSGQAASAQTARTDIGMVQGVHTAEQTSTLIQAATAANVTQVMNPTAAADARRL